MPFPPRFLEHYRKADRIMLGLIWLMFFFALGLAFWNDTFTQAFVVGGGTSLLLTVLYRAIGGTRLMRCFLAFGLMVMAALHINQAEGAIESHFGIFALLAVLTFYRDWLPIGPRVGQGEHYAGERRQASVDGNCSDDAAGAAHGRRDGTHRRARRACR